MHLQSATIRNFRMHLDTSVSFGRSTTVVVGRNNSGKTSVTELFRKFLGDGQGRSGSGFTLDDFSSAAHGTLLAAARSVLGDDSSRSEPPAIELELTISYADSLDDLSAISDFIVDLDDDCTTTTVVLRYARSSAAAGESFFDELPPDDAKALDLIDERIRRTYEVVVEAVDPTDEKNRSERPLSALRECVQLGFIDAARPMGGDRGREPETLGRTLSALFDASRQGKEDGAATAIEKGVAEAEGVINELFGKQMKGRILPSFSPLGYPLLSDGELETRTTFDAIQLLRQNTRLYYGSSAGIGAGRPLPEGHNGLGIRNLIFILLQLHAFHEARRTAIVPPPVCILFLEEPEAHLHPQLEEIFIRKVKEVHETLCGETKWSLQIVVTTHSSHIANEVPFDQIRYFRRRPSLENAQWMAEVRDLGRFSADDDVKTWLTQYLTLTRCDLFFADKAVLIEGAAERLLLPAFLRKSETATATDDEPLTAQYLTVVEVDGRHAHKFYPLLDFIGVPALIVTDLDAEAHAPAKSGATKKDGTPRITSQKRLVCKGTHSGNPCINAWFNDASLADLMGKSADEKKSSKGTEMRVAYQIPEQPGMPCGRSFEEALILANPSRWPPPIDPMQAPDEAETWASEIAQIEGKTSLALALLGEVNSENFVIPKYMREGLRWLTTAGKPELVRRDDVTAVDATGADEEGGIDA